ncbi:hypothetical protein TPHA_0G03630 [Tetrapisispora phaffii CBS 4417]|uniref:Importin N-terminal domain-containing protein n=1 Tax=Tetrapisispora phaffii (strain ATCC 24235 / CBS 4417 / NBRC 1672 / NRRL Y-8282 / UCD 70-5) TaxID=1071381 RepID=G8BWC5_TETPH|nr:hypothetical protein TPHA_0G03630 [Tetrapisispora phaffii CBS 4417]CCE64203.1 hypothetical protein TPHA_0G03630 [Tetrapisispora phaffii CBS 4417]
MPDVHLLIAHAQSADNNVRENAESELLQKCDENASVVFNSLIELANNINEPLSSRQFCILSLKKLITMYWSPGFDSYRGTSNVQEETKEFLRDSLLKLCLNTEQDSKIKSSSSYCIVQISAIDFPDLWPNLLVVIYNAILKDHSIEAMSLLNEIYDDVISEEMFFEGGVGEETIKTIFAIFTSPETNIKAKVAASKLLHSTVLQMSILDNSMSFKRKDFVSQCITKLLDILLTILPHLDVNQSEDALQLKTNFYEELTTIKTEFPKKLFHNSLVTNFKAISLKDLEIIGSSYLQFIDSDASGSQLQLINEYGVHLIDFISSLSVQGFDKVDLTRIVSSLVMLCCLDNNTYESWESDFNTFISKEAGLLANYTIRDQTMQFFSDLEKPTYSIAYGIILEELNKSMENYNNWKLQESLLYTLQSIISSEEEFNSELLGYTENVLNSLGKLLMDPSSNIMVKSRCLLLCPKYLEKFMESYTAVKPMTKELLSTSLNLSLNTSSEILKSSMLIAFSYYASYADLSSVLGSADCISIQQGLLKIIKDIANDAEEDTYAICVETISNVIDNNSSGTGSDEVRDNEFNILLEISFKDPGNIQLSVESQECLEKLLDGMDISLYIYYAEKVIPLLIKIIADHASTNYDYSPLLSLTLDFLMTFMKKKPVDSTLPVEISKLVFNPVCEVLLSSNEEETIQLATEAFSFLVFNSDVSLMQTVLENIVNVLSKLLSLNISDTAAMNVGTLIITIFSKFSQQIQELLPAILQATTQKFVNAKNIITSQNLLMVFCFLICSDPQQTVDFLYNLSLEDQQEENTLTLVLKKWLELFDIIRGEKRIKENIIALSKIYLLLDKRIELVIVNGDIIPYSGDKIITRSMAKSIPDQFTQMPIYEKIVKLFLGELASQSKNISDANLHSIDIQKLARAEENQVEQKLDSSEDDDWEDVEDVLDYEKLQEYVDDDDDELANYTSDEDNDTPTGQIIGDINQSVSELIINFFKEVTSKNINSFQDIYSSLSEDEKKLLANALV